MAPTQGDAPAGTRGPVANQLIATTAFDALGGTPTASTLRALAPRLRMLPGRTFVVLATDGGPNCNYASSCGADRCIVNIESLAPSCTPDGSVNCCSAEFFGPANCLDDDPTVAAIAELRNAGIPTYVIGVPGSAPYANLLDRMATAGGTALPESPRYYRVDTASEGAIDRALSLVAARATGSCELALANVPDPERVNVYLDGSVIARDGDGGWRLDEKKVVLLGPTCQRVLSGDVLNVRVVAGCPTVLR